MEILEGMCRFKDELGQGASVFLGTESKVLKFTCSLTKASTNTHIVLLIFVEGPKVDLIM
jgi:hypothetical protein